MAVTPGARDAFLAALGFAVCSAATSAGATEDALRLVEHQRPLGGATPASGEQTSLNRDVDRGQRFGETVLLAQAQPVSPVGQAPQDSERPAQPAPIFEQPGVLTPRGQLLLEPSLQYSHSSGSRVALVGYTIIPSILIGLIDVREVRRDTFTLGLTARYGFTNRLEGEFRVPFVYRSDSAVGREFLEGTSQNSVFEASGQDLGDIEATARYQLNDGGASSPYYVASLRFKSRTGKDPFELEYSNDIGGFRDEPLPTELATGSGFLSLQPALTILYPSDPAVLFGTVSYTYNFERKNLTRVVDGQTQEIGTIAPGGVFGFNVGMGLALNDKASLSVGYEHNVVGKTRQNGVTAPDSVRIQLASLLFGFSYRLSNSNTLSFSLGAGLTQDAPDVTLTVRTPFSI